MDSSNYLWIPGILTWLLVYKRFEDHEKEQTELIDKSTWTAVRFNRQQKIGQCTYDTDWKCSWMHTDGPLN